MTRKIQLTLTINFISSKDDNDEEHEKHSKSNNIEIMMNKEADHSKKRYLKRRYQSKLEESMEGSEFVFDYLHLLYYKCHKIHLSCGGSYIDSPDWIKNKKAAINPINKKYNKCFQYAATVLLIYEEIKKNSQKITKMKPWNLERNKFFIRKK